MGNKKVICIGEVLWDALPKGIYLGGSPLNVALNLYNLGVDSEIISAVGKDSLGRLALKSIKQKGMETDYVQINNYPTGLAEVEINEEGGPSFNIHENTAWDFITLTDEIREVVLKSDLLVLGTLAFRNSTGNTIRELLENYKGKCVVDLNLRPPFYSEEIVNEVLGYADILKLNYEELQIIKDWKNKELGEEEYLKRLSEEYKIETIFLTQGEKGAYIYSKGELQKKGSYNVEVHDTVGAGDAFLSGAIYSFLKGRDAYETLCFANAVGAFVASRNGATPIINRSKIDRLLSS